MTQEEKIQVGEQWILLSQMYGKEVSRDVLRFMLEAVEDLPFNGVLSALKNWAKHSKQNRPPLPADLRAIAMPEEDDQSTAIEAASRIITATSRFGYPSPDEPKEYIGELGWAVVQRFGGWMHVCENLGDELNLTTFQAQARDIAKSMIVRGKAGLTNQAPQIPVAKRDEIAQTSPEITKLISGMKTLKESDLD